MKCLKCRTDNALRLLTSWLCRNPGCEFFDKAHADELVKDDPLEAAMQQYLKRKLQLDMWKEYNGSQN